MLRSERLPGDPPTAAPSGSLPGTPTRHAGSCARNGAQVPKICGGDRCRWFEDLGLDNKMPVWAVRLQGMRAAETCVTMLLDHSSTCAWIARRQVSFLSSMREQRKCVYSIR
ncbi:unnamed protein product [Effrenium voratum]|nr:unnamed protein product [Effrenium voratum]